MRSADPRQHRRARKGGSDRTGAYRRMFLNRLWPSIWLTADSTVVTAVSGGCGVLNHSTKRGDLEQDDPTNPSGNGGLPPGRACALRPASLCAVLYPALRNDLCAVADGGGAHVFTAIPVQHEANVKRYPQTSSSSSCATTAITRPAAAAPPSMHRADPARSIPLRRLGVRRHRQVLQRH
jgi:hypothetical protein